MEPIESTSGGDVRPAPAALFNRNFLLLWLGQAVSQLGNRAYNIAMNLWLMERTGSASLMGLLMTVSALPGVLLGPFGGTFADRHSRIRILIVCDLIAGLATGTLALALWARPNETNFLIALVFVVGLLLGIIGTYFQPAINAAVPDLIPEKFLAGANSVIQGTGQISVLVGQAIGGVLYTLLGPVALFLADGISFLVASGAEAFIPRDRPRHRETPAEGHPFRHFLRETAEGFRWVWARKGMRGFLLGVSLINFLATPVLVLFPFYVKLYLHAGPKWYGFLMASFGGGALAGFLLAGMLKLTGSARARGILAGLLLYPVCFSTLAFLRTPSLALVTLFAGGMTMGFINVYLITLMQSSTPAELRGRVMSLVSTLAGSLTPIGMALGGIVGDLTNKNVPLILLVTVTIALAVALFLAFSRSCREYLANS